MPKTSFRKNSGTIMPDWVIGDVGTTIYQVRTGEWRHWPQWEQDIAADWQGLTANALRPLFSDLPSLRLQEEARQNRYKLSYYLPLLTDIDALQREMSRRLKTLQVAAGLIYSVDEATSTGLLDVLPAYATKLHAVEFLMRHQGFDYANTVFAGDSGNDLPLLASAIQSVMVANADLDVVEQAKAQARQQGTTAAFYLAQGGFLGMNGNYSAGILEGVAHYHPGAQIWMENMNNNPLIRIFGEVLFDHFLPCVQRTMGDLLFTTKSTKKYKLERDGVCNSSDCRKRPPWLTPGGLIPAYIQVNVHAPSGLRSMMIHRPDLLIYLG